MNHQEITNEAFDHKLRELIDENPASSLLSIPGVYEAVSEEFNNAVLEAIEGEPAPVVVREIYHGGLQALVSVPHPSGDVLVMVGVPDCDLETARRCSCTDGMVDVWPFGDSLDMWCPEGLEPEAALEDVYEAAIAAWVPLPLEWPGPTDLRHLRSTRLRNNAGMDFPECKSGDELLDLEAGKWPMTRKLEEVTCPECLGAIWEAAK